MVSKTRITIINVAIIVTLLTANVASTDYTIPADRAQLETWFSTNFGPLEQRKATLDPALVTAEATPKIIKVNQDGSGEFKTITDALNSIPSGNTQRVILNIGAGNYNEKIKVERTKPFVTFYGSPNSMPNITYAGTAAQYGTVDSATVIVEGDYFVAANIIISVCILSSHHQLKLIGLLFVYEIFFLYEIFWYRILHHYLMEKGQVLKLLH
jgi:pectinesterase